MEIYEAPRDSQILDTGALNRLIGHNVGEGEEERRGRSEHVPFLCSSERQSVCDRGTHTFTHISIHTHTHTHKEREDER